MFDSDFDTTDTLDTDDVEFLDTSDAEIETSDVDDVEEVSELSDEVSDDLYHATKMSPEEVERIDDMWSDTEIAASDIEPYRATPNDVVAETDVTEPYRAVRSSESNDMSIDISESGNALDMESTMSLEEQFASDIESMSFDDLSAEQARLDELSRMDDLDIFSTYDIQQKEKYDSELLDTLTDGLSKEALEHLRDGLANGDPEVYDYFGLNGDVEDGNNEGPTLTLRR